MELFDDLRWRGLVYQTTDEAALRARLLEGPITCYIGFDPTAESLHIGNLLGLTLLRRFQEAGHRPIAVAGGATGMIGDPGGRSEERNLLDSDTLGRNLDAIRLQIARFIDFDHDALLVNNADWTMPFSAIDFLRDVGKHFSVNAMLAKDSVKSRLEGAGISFTEFSYMLLQSYDFVHLYRTYGCELQMGGSDQWGNITAGVDLARRMDGAHLHALTHPLVTRSDGVKLGKSADGGAWLAADRTSPYQFFQWLLRIPDADVSTFLRFYTFLPHDEIEDLERQAAEKPEGRVAQRALASAVTELVHGADGLRGAERATDALFGGSLEGLSEADLLDIFADVPSATVTRSQLGEGLAAIDAFTHAGLAKSRSEARRLLESGGAYVNNDAIAADEVLGSSHLATASVMVLRAGKRRFALLRAAD
jgi:tyrosyl-tRNA synthetase